ncbi:MAG TPA: RNA methyltransferase [Alphaproteobacteria bacterium]|nr:RNA methyltransferase [Alphaproteobacteria bacterium]
MDENTLTIILVEPQLGQNIGAVARAMLNFGLTDLRLVNPRDGWPNPEAIPPSAGADKILNNARVYSSTLAAIKDLNLLFATSSRIPDMIKSIYAPKAALEYLTSVAQQGQKVGVLFGGERCGLRKEDISLCESLIKIPTKNDFHSLNLAHAVALVSYEWFTQISSFPSQVFRTGRTCLATREDLGNLFTHLEGELDRTGFLRHQKKRANMVRNIRNIFQRASLTEQEVRTLRGIIRSLAREPEDVRKTKVM